MLRLAIVLFVILTGCAPCLGPRICRTPLPAGRFAEVPPGWISPDSVERMPRYNPEDLLETMRLSYIAYDSTRDSIASLAPDTVVIELGTISFTDAGGSGWRRELTGIRGLIWHHPTKNRDYVAIRGTDNLGNAVLDALYPKVPDPVLGLSVHKGVKLLVDRMIDTVRAHLSPTREVWLTGHSLGGAAATLMYLRFFEQDSYVLGPLYTFAAMRVLTDDAIKRYRCLPILRVVNWSDPAPHLPPSREGCRNEWDPGCHGTFAQLGDELVIVNGTAPCRYSTGQHASVTVPENAAGFIQDLIEDGELDKDDLHVSLQDLQMHLPQLYYDKVRDWVQAGARPCDFCCHSRQLPGDRWYFHCGCTR